MDELILIGLNHKTAPIELRECFAFTNEETRDALDMFRSSGVVSEAMVVSTCNRVEILMTATNTPAAVNMAKGYLAETKKLPLVEFEKALYIHYGEAAVRHLFRVAASLDSMMVGEPQILGQIKDAYRSATAEHTAGVLLNRLLHRTFFVAKRVRSETGIGDHAVSISYAAAELAKKIFGSLEGKQALLIGAGEMAELAVEHLIRNHTDAIYVANRTFERGVELAKRFNGQAIRFEEISSCLEKVDIIISSTGSPDFVITREQVKDSMRTRRNRPLFFIDIAVPRDIDPEINRLNNAYVYDIDDLKDVIEENIEDRKKEALKGERIVDEAVIQFRQWYHGLDVVPTIVALRKKFDTIAQSEVEKTLRSLNHLSANDAQTIKRMTQAIMNKLLHDPTTLLKNSDAKENQADYVNLVQNLFKLDDFSAGKEENH